MDRIAEFRAYYRRKMATFNDGVRLAREAASDVYTAQAFANHPTVTSRYFSRALAVARGMNVPVTFAERFGRDNKPDDRESWARYNAERNDITMRPLAHFPSDEFATMVLLHELGHATGVVFKRVTMFGDDGVKVPAFVTEALTQCEEAIAELSAVLTADALGVPLDHKQDDIWRRYVTLALGAAVQVQEMPEKLAMPLVIAESQRAARYMTDAATAPATALAA